MASIIHFLQDYTPLATEFQGYKHIFQGCKHLGLTGLAKVYRVAFREMPKTERKKIDVDVFHFQRGMQYLRQGLKQIAPGTITLGLAVFLAYRL